MQKNIRRKNKNPVVLATIKSTVQEQKNFLLKSIFPLALPFGICYNGKKLKGSEILFSHAQKMEVFYERRYFYRRYPLGRLGFAGL